MSNMSYCRFENTCRDLSDCQDALEDMVRGDAKKLSDTELAAARRLAQMCLDIVVIVAEAGGIEPHDIEELSDEKVLAACIVQIQESASE